MTRYFIPSNQNISSTSTVKLPLIKMDDTIKRTVTDILKSSDIDSITEKHVRNLASHKLGFQLNDLSHKILVRHVVESFLLENDDVLGTNIDNCNNVNHSNNINNNVNNVLGNGNVDGGVEEEVEIKPVVSHVDNSRVICKLSQKRDVAVRRSGGKSEVSIRELFWKDGKQIPTPKCITLPGEEWSIFRKSFPAIEETISKLESRLRSEVVNTQANGDRNRMSESSLDKQNSRRNVNCAELLPKDGTVHKPGFMASEKQVEDASIVPSTTRGMVPIEVIRFDGNNYQQWADRIESYLTHMKVDYVLSDPCPSAVGVTIGELSQALSDIQKWRDDDHICRQSILNSLCDNLFCHYSNKTGTAKDLWEELRLVYLYEAHGAKVSLVKKYIEFQIVDGKSVVEQVQELHHIADSLTASGMYVEEKFHVNVIISKLPPSWKPYSIDLMKEECLPVWMLMNSLKTVEESRLKGNKSEVLLPKPTDLPVFNSAKKFGPQKIPMKKHGVHMANYEMDREKKFKFCTICKKKGHLPEQCWFRNPPSKANANGMENDTSADGSS